MFIYEKDGKLNIMVKGGKPAGEGVTPDVTIEAGASEGAVVKVNGTTVAVLTDIPEEEEASSSDGEA